MNRLVEKLIESDYLRTDNIIKAFSVAERKYFVSEDLIAHCDLDMPLPIGSGQTISQPQTVAFMMELLQPEDNQNVLDIGSGSGWTTALLALIVGKHGMVSAMEISPELCKMGEDNLRKFGLGKKENIQFYCLSAKDGLEKNAPYDRILVSASVDLVPEALKRQLVVGGKMVIPVGNEIWKFEKKDDDEFEIKKFPGFVFVPFIKK